MPNITEAERDQFKQRARKLGARDGLELLIESIEDQAGHFENSGEPYLAYLSRQQVEKLWDAALEVGEIQDRIESAAPVAATGRNS